mmetsp:Transcript_19379/g.54137  ORF Transcript_19379/g.54137 Transcript_19379/m.54137 type:complete len:201 (-) Transcript_19379:131-733(-)
MVHHGGAEVRQWRSRLLEVPTIVHDGVRQLEDRGQGQVGRRPRGRQQCRDRPKHAWSRALLGRQSRRPFRLRRRRCLELVCGRQPQALLQREPLGRVPDIVDHRSEASGARVRVAVGQDAALQIPVRGEEAATVGEEAVRLRAGQGVQVPAEQDPGPCKGADDAPQGVQLPGADLRLVRLPAQVRRRHRDAALARVAAYA